LDVRLAEAAGNRLSHDQFLDLVLRDELAVRSSRQVERRVRAAMFRDVKSLDEFDFAFNSSIKRKTVSDLATCRFVREKQDVLLLGPPGVGKSFLVQAIGHQAVKCGMLVLYRSIFDLARDFLHDEAASAKEQDRMLSRYLKPDLLIIDDMGMKQLPDTRRGRHAKGDTRQWHQLKQFSADFSVVLSAPPSACSAGHTPSCVV
jgi:DNA replication protein DnaC